MARLLAPYIVPIVGALFGLIVALSIALWWSITSHSETKAALEAANGRISNIKTSQEIDHDIQNLDDAAIDSELTKRLSGDAE